MLLVYGPLTGKYSNFVNTNPALFVLKMALSVHQFPKSITHE